MTTTPTAYDYLTDTGRQVVREMASAYEGLGFDYDLHLDFEAHGHETLAAATLAAYLTVEGESAVINLASGAGMIQPQRPTDVLARIEELVGIDSGTLVEENADTLVFDSNGAIDGTTLARIRGRVTHFESLAVVKPLLAGLMEVRLGDEDQVRSLLREGAIPF